MTYQKLTTITLFAIVVGIITIYVVLPHVLNFFGIDVFKIDPFLSTMISVSTGVYISVVVYVFAKKQEISRKHFLIKQMIDYLELLKKGYGNDILNRQCDSDGSRSELRINESFFNQKNAIALHIFDSANELENKINPLLSELIKSVSMHALGFPEIKKNTKGEYLEPDYSQYRVFLAGMDVVLDFLNNCRDDYDSIPKEQEKIVGIQQETQEN